MPAFSAIFPMICSMALLLNCTLSESLASLTVFFALLAEYPRKSHDDIEILSPSSLLSLIICWIFHVASESKANLYFVVFLLQLIPCESGRFGGTFTIAIPPFVTSSATMPHVRDLRTPMRWGHPFKDRIKAASLEFSARSYMLVIFSRSFWKGNVVPAVEAPYRDILVFPGRMLDALI